MVSGAAPATELKPMMARAALAATEIPPPTRADRPARRPQTAKQRIAATTVMTTWPSTTLPASRLAWGNSRVTTTLLLQVGQSANKTRAHESRGRHQRCSKIVWLGNDLRVPWPGARIIYADPRRLNTEPALFLGIFTYRALETRHSL